VYNNTLFYIKLRLRTTAVLYNTFPIYKVLLLITLNRNTELKFTCV
jgi:hypothetical protein